MGRLKDALYALSVELEEREGRRDELQRLHSGKHGETKEAEAAIKKEITDVGERL